MDNKQNPDKSTKICPFCAEEIKTEAQKCKYCGEFLNSNNTITSKLINNSGMNEPTIPENIKGWNWGAFLLTWIWGIGNNSYLTLLVFIPYFGMIWAFVSGAKGNEWAWKNKKWKSVEHFYETQKVWATLGVGITLLWWLMLLIIILNMS